MLGAFFLLGALIYFSSQNRSSIQRSLREKRAENEANWKELNISSCVTLRDSVCVPRLGFGTAALGGNKVKLIKSAIKAGYRLFDSASDTGPWYKSEEAIGKAFRETMFEMKSEEEREEMKRKLMVSSKLHPFDFNTIRLDASLYQTYTNLQKPYVDIYFLHYPNCGPKGSESLCPKRDGSEGDFLTVWPLLEQRLLKGSIGVLGVANFRLDQLKILMDSARFKPSIVQSWFDPYHQDWDLVNFCKEHHIVFQSYSSLGTQWKHRAETDFKNPILKDPVLLDLASKYHKSVPQIILRWLLQEDIFIIPRSNSEEHILENIEIFDFSISDADMDRIRSLKR
jgi:diketogulonate reductase-like aldo/keto reductase